MKELFNEPILDQMYEFRKEDFDQLIYQEDDKIKEGELHICELSENFISYLEKIIPNIVDFKNARKMFSNYESEFEKQADLWNRRFFKLGIIDGNKMKNELSTNKFTTANKDTFLNYMESDFCSWLETQKRKYTLETEEYKELQNKYNKISEKYPNVIEVFENLEPITLNKEEMKALVELRDIDIAMESMENKLCFKLGMKEVINF